MASKTTITIIKLIIIVIIALLPPSAFAAERTIKYFYDDLNRLVQEEYEGGKMSVYEYDEVGNRTAKYTAYTPTIITSGSGGSIT